MQLQRRADSFDCTCIRAAPTYVHSPMIDVNGMPHHHPELTNFGQVLRNPSTASEPQRTLVVLGRARGGTTMVAAMLAQLGVFMGEELTSDNLEDLQIQKLIRHYQPERMRKEIGRRNKHHDVWGIKHPALFNHLPDLLDALRHPCWIVVVRDPVAITARKIQAGRVPAEEAEACMRTEISNYAKIIAFVADSQRPALFLSYEKCLLQPRQAALSLGAFAGVTDDALIERASASIVPDNPVYLASVARSRRVP